MTAEALAALQARAYRDMAPWSADMLRATLAQPDTRLWQNDHGFLLARVILDEAEILSLATDPSHQRQGLARQLMEACHRDVQIEGVTRCFLEVAEPNLAARALYSGLGYQEAGRRKQYYKQADGRLSDALLMARALP